MSLRTCDGETCEKVSLDKKKRNQCNVSKNYFGNKFISKIVVLLWEKVLILTKNLVGEYVVSTKFLTK